VVGAGLLANGPSLDGDPPISSNPVVVRTAAEARAAVDTLANLGADFVKVHENLSREAGLSPGTFGNIAREFSSFMLVDQQSLQDVGVPAEVHATHPAGRSWMMSAVGRTRFSPSTSTQANRLSPVNHLERHAAARIDRLFAIMRPPRLMGMCRTLPIGPSTRSCRAVATRAVRSAGTAFPVP
jgi:hypothetical protein